MLVVLYVGQYRLQGRQVRLENRPHLIVEEYDEEGNTIDANLSNLGNGVATDIELETSIDFSVVNSDLLGNEYEQTVYGTPYEVELGGPGVDVEEVIVSGSPASWAGRTSDEPIQ